MGFFIKSGLVKYSFTFQGAELYNIGSTPLQLNTPAGFMPLAVNFTQIDGLIPFDFTVGDQYTIIDITTNRSFFVVGNSIDSLNSGLCFPGTYFFNAVPINTLLNVTTDGLLLTTILSSDATVGDSTLQLTIAGYNL